jgi:hypothetical protein
MIIPAGADGNHGVTAPRVTGPPRAPRIIRI